MKTILRLLAKKATVFIKKRGIENSEINFLHCLIQLFRERLSEKVHATIVKGIVGCFVCPVLQRKLK